MPINPKILSRVLGIFFLVMFVFVGLWFLLSEFIAPTVPTQVPAVVRNSMMVFACVAGAGALFVRFNLIANVLSREAPGDITRALTKLRTYHILCYMLSEATAMSGFVLRFLGARRSEALPFFIGAAILFVLCYPRVPMEPRATSASLNPPA